MKQAEKDSRREYQDTPFPDFRKHVGIWADLERLRPRGDCVVIRVVPEPEMHANLIWIPERARGSDNAPRIGEVVALGKGDRLFPVYCPKCGHDPLFGDQTPLYRTESSRQWTCRICGTHLQSLRNPQTAETVIWNCPMHVKPGDWVYYWRVFANQVEINKEIYQFVREEQHILAVLEKEPEGVSIEEVHAYDHEMIQQGHWTPLEKESNGTRN